MDDNGGKHDLNCSNISSGEDNIMMNWELISGGSKWMELTDLKKCGKYKRRKEREKKEQEVEKGDSQEKKQK